MSHFGNPDNLECKNTTFPEKMLFLSFKVKKNRKMLQIGTKAPYFEGVDENGKSVSLKDFAGKKLVLYF